MADKPKDPFHKDNIDSTIKNRKIDLDNTVEYINAMDNHAHYQTVSILKKHAKKNKVGELYTLLDKTHKNFSKEAEKEVTEAINKSYDTSDEIHPLNGLHEALSKENFYNAELIKGIYTGHKDDILKNMGKKNFLKTMKQHQKENLEKVTMKLHQKTPNGITTDEHRKNVVDYFMDKFKADKKKVSMDYLIHHADEIVINHSTGFLNSADGLHEMGKEYRGPPKKES
ncbi:MAG: hypothetical protein ABH828_04515 [archaeon]